MATLQVNNQFAIFLQRHAFVLIASSTLWVVSSTVGADEIIKCRSRTGQIIYSDVPCEKQGATRMGVVDATPNEVGAIKPRPVDPNRGAGMVTRFPDSTVQVTSKITRKDPEERARRENELALILRSIVSTNEQKIAASQELSGIATMGVCLLDDEQRKQRDGAYADLGSLVRARRPPAFAVLNRILGACDRG